MNDANHFDRAIERLLADQSPREEVEHLSDEELDMVQMAQLLRGSRDAAPNRQFVDRLHDQLFDRETRVSRRTAFVSGLGAMAAGVLAGLGIERFAQSNSSSKNGTVSQQPPLVLPTRGKWFHVANVTELPQGAVQRFTAGHVSGFLINHSGDIRAISSICSHMGCGLTFQQADQSFLCPCHGAEFDIRGRFQYGANGYVYEIPNLPPINVRIQGDKIEVLGA